MTPWYPSTAWGPVELDEDTMGFEDLAEGDEEALGDFNKDVAAQEPRFSGVVNQAKVQGPEGAKKNAAGEFQHPKGWSGWSQVWRMTLGTYPPGSQLGNCGRLDKNEPEWEDMKDGILTYFDTVFRSTGP